MIKYGFYKELDKTFAEAAEIILPKLEEHGFTIVSQIDLKEKFKQKLDIDFKEYTILGLCDPQSAYNAVTKEENIGLMLPCNMIVYEKEGKTAVAIMKPKSAMEALGNEELDDVACEVEHKLKKLFDSIE